MAPKPVTRHTGLFILTRRNGLAVVVSVKTLVDVCESKNTLNSKGHMCARRQCSGVGTKGELLQGALKATMFTFSGDGRNLLTFFGNR